MDELRNLFGQYITSAVFLITDMEGKNRKEKKRNMYKNLDHWGDRYPEALIVKAADRLANLRESAVDPDNSKLKMYRKEHAEFRKTVYRKGLVDKIWDEIEQIIKG
jgi:(p)ppGpp synthase/HD superfamily hydrolase